MLGWRGASRYLDPDFKDAFDMELEAILRVYKRYKNLTLMIPFIRHPNEAKNVTKYIRDWFELAGEPVPKLIFMAEVPSITLVPEAFHEYTDGYSFGTNDLTQLVTGSDRDSPRLLFNENIASVKRAISILADSAHVLEKPKELGVCGQAPSDIKEFIEFLVVYVDYISVNPDVIISTIKTISEVEEIFRDLITENDKDTKKIASLLSSKFKIHVSEMRAKLLMIKLGIA
jgi:pyruvate,water dikinase